MLLEETRYLSKNKRKMCCFFFNEHSNNRCKYAYINILCSLFPLGCDHGVPQFPVLCILVNVVFSLISVCPSFPQTFTQSD